MNFVDDINFIAGIGRLITYAVQNLADIIYAGTRSRVKLQNVNMAVSGNSFTILTHAAGMNRRPTIAIKPRTVQSAGNQTGGGGFAHAADTG